MANRTNCIGSNGRPSSVARPTRAVPGRDLHVLDNAGAKQPSCEGAGPERLIAVPPIHRAGTPRQGRGLPRVRAGDPGPRPTGVHPVWDTGR